MLRFLTKLFVIPFYKSNAGFFLFFFFFFFGVVQSGSLITYHQQLMVSILQSKVILVGVFIFWALYHFKCTSYCLRLVNSNEGSFLFNMQILSARRQLLFFLLLHIALYTPVLVYSLFLMWFGWQRNDEGSVALIVLFQCLILCLGAGSYYWRMNSWMVKKKTIELGFLHRIGKPLILILLYHFTLEKKAFFLSLKALSLVLLFVALVWNKEVFDNDSFIFFFQLIILTHSAVSFKAVNFLEEKLSFHRNLPLGVLQYAMMYLVSYILILTPELFYLLFNGSGLMNTQNILYYIAIAIATLCLLTAIQYSESMNRNEYIKVVFALFFVSTIVLHAEAFLFWIIAQVFIACILFWNGFYKYEKLEEI